MYPPEFIEEMKQRLLLERQRLQQDLAPLHPHTELGDDDIDDSAREVEMDEVNQDLIARITADLAKIDVALAKIADGTYGIDADGNEISQERLNAIPWADKAI
jgi:RNA polymerase-binding transcription factor DksA